MDLDGINEVGNRTSEEQTAGAYGADFAAGSLAGVGAKDRSRIKVSSDKELTDMKKFTE